MPLTTIVENAGGKLTLNKNLWEELNHYLDPFEILLLNSDREIQVGDKLYRFDEEAVFELNELGSWEMTLFYGKEGNVHDMELLKIRENTGQLHLLKDYEFLSPGAALKFKELSSDVANGRLNTFSQGSFILTSENYNNDPTHQYTGSDENQAYRVSYSGRNGSTVQAITRALVNNEEYKSGPFPRASGATIFQVKDLDATNGRHSTNWVTPTTLKIDGTPGSSGEVIPYTYVKVVAKKHKEDFGDGWSASRSKVKRSGGKTAVSRHRIHYRSNGSSTRKEIFNLIEWQ